jgi:hypothetical protein
LPFLILIAALLCSTTTSAIAGSAGLRAAIDAAWAREPRAAAFDARAGVAQSREEAVRAPFAGPPSLTLAHRTDELTGNRGKREFETGISAPVWIGPERAARLDVLAHERQEIDAATKLARWKVAGEVRATLGQAAAAREHAAHDPGKEILYPVAVVIFGGLASSNVLDTILTPVMFLRWGERPLARLLASGERDF